MGDFKWFMFGLLVFDLNLQQQHSKIMILADQA